MSSRTASVGERTFWLKVARDPSQKGFCVEVRRDGELIFTKTKETRKQADDYAKKIEETMLAALVALS